MSAPILREPEPPKLNDTAIELLTQLCFGMQDALDRRSESILIFGTSRRESQEMCVDEFRRIQRCLQPKEVYVTGGCVKSDSPESQEILRLINTSRYSEMRFKSEQVSKSTIENALQAAELGLGLNKDVVFMAAHHHCGRCRLTLMKYMPHLEIRQHGYIPRLDGMLALISPRHWHCEPFYRSHVWGEFLRIREYGKQGVIAYPSEAQTLVERIEQVTADQR